MKYLATGVVTLSFPLGEVEADSDEQAEEIGEALLRTTIHANRFQGAAILTSCARAKKLKELEARKSA